VSLIKQIIVESLREFEWVFIDEIVLSCCACNELMLKKERKTRIEKMPKYFKNEFIYL
jgi:hypothetical protein